MSSEIPENLSEKSSRLWDWPAALFLLAAMLTASRRLVATDWTDDLEMLQTLTLLGTISGLALGYSRFSKRTSFNFGLVYGVFFIGWELGRMLGAGIEWMERLYSLLGRLMASIDKLALDQAVTDPLLFLVSMSILYWILSVVAGFSLTRTGQAWRSIIPSGITLVIIHTYDAYLKVRIWILALFLLFSLALTARVYFLKQRE
jgi:hypothetical protein